VCDRAVISSCKLHLDRFHMAVNLIVTEISQRCNLWFVTWWLEICAHYSMIGSWYTSRGGRQWCQHQHRSARPSRLPASPSLINLTQASLVDIGTLHLISYRLNLSNTGCKLHSFFYHSYVVVLQNVRLIKKSLALDVPTIFWFPI